MPHNSGAELAGRIERMADDHRWPDWQASGREVEVMLADQTIITGKLKVVGECFTGVYAIPMFSVVDDHGSYHPLEDCKAWRY